MWLKRTLVPDEDRKQWTWTPLNLRRPTVPAISPPLVDGDSIAYLTLERMAIGGSEPRFRLGSAGYGPAGRTLAERVCIHIEAWGRDRTAEPLISLDRPRPRTPSLPTGTSSTSRPRA